MGGGTPARTWVRFGVPLSPTSSLSSLLQLHAWVSHLQISLFPRGENRINRAGQRCRTDRIGLAAPEGAQVSRRGRSSREGMRRVAGGELRCNLLAAASLLCFRSFFFSRLLVCSYFLPSQKSGFAKMLLFLWVSIKYYSQPKCFD